MVELRRMLSFGIPDVALGLVLGFIDDPRDRAAISLVCRAWHRADALSRQHVTIAMSYATGPARLARRFPSLVSLKIKSKPRAAMFNLIPHDWGGAAAPWIAHIAAPTPPSFSFDLLRSLHLRRMVVTDSDLSLLLAAKAPILLSLKLDRCDGFSTLSLSLIASSCRRLETLFLEDSAIEEKGTEWLHELAVNNTTLVTLNFYLTELSFSSADLELLARNCRSLTTLKISERDISDLVGLFHAATALQDFGGGSFDDEKGMAANDKYNNFYFHPSLQSLSLMFMGTNEMHVIFPYAATLKKLDLQYALLSTEDHCQLIPRCPNLLVLAVREVVGDRGLEVVAQTCRQLRRLRVERGEDDQGGVEDEQGRVSQAGLINIAHGCPDLEYLAVHVSDITNAALESIGTYCKNLFDFRLVLLDRDERITELPLDNGVRALLRGCSNLGRFALYLRPGGLSDTGLGYIGEHSKSIRYMLLGNVGESDRGLMLFAGGCPNLQKLELRSCCFSERALALAVMRLPSLRYIWVQGYKATPDGSDLSFMVRPFWNIEIIPPGSEPDSDSQAQILAYYSLVGKRTDLPSYIRCIPPS
ncbi:Coronatine-insensitive protein 1 [Rhynchospora pubera]|uniref:Coronatine-insensitive protein 1 n=1 Tax=Rhynchospora pubera TaxID=906938 RepID=A0AAV8HF22_9POAL|nr:Coronatine-insensitive protein 1 [Rhynchospora pubera]